MSHPLRHSLAYRRPSGRPFRKITHQRVQRARDHASRAFELYMWYNAWARTMLDRHDKRAATDPARARTAMILATGLDRKASHWLRRYTQLLNLCGLYDMVLTDRADTIRAWQEKYPYSREQVAEMLSSCGASPDAVTVVLESL